MPDTRGRSGSVQNEDLKELLMQLEKNLSTQLSNVMLKIESFERTLEAIQVNQVRLDTEINGLKEVVSNQQKQIELMEKVRRENNVVVQGIPEDDVKVDDEVLVDDKQKTMYLMNVVGISDIGSDSIEVVTRIGKKQHNRNRMLLVKFTEKCDRDRFLFEQKKLRESSTCKDGFGTIFVNRDLSMLMRKEHRRLRSRMKDLRGTSSDQDRFYIKNDKLFRNNSVVDQVDISKQLF